VRIWNRAEFGAFARYCEPDDKSGAMGCAVREHRENQEIRFNGAEMGRGCAGTVFRCWGMPVILSRNGGAFPGHETARKWRGNRQDHRATRSPFNWC